MRSELAQWWAELDRALDLDPEDVAGWVDPLGDDWYRERTVEDLPEFAEYVIAPEDAPVSAAVSAAASAAEAAAEVAVAQVWSATASDAAMMISLVGADPDAALELALTDPGVVGDLVAAVRLTPTQVAHATHTNQTNPSDGADRRFRLGRRLSQLRGLRRGGRRCRWVSGPRGRRWSG